MVRFWAILLKNSVKLTVGQKSCQSRSHNHYPSIAEEIRVKLGASSRQLRDAARDKLKLEREKASKLRKELAEATSQIAKLASINETLLLENKVLRAEASASNEQRLGTKIR